MRSILTGFFVTFHQVLFVLLALVWQISLKMQLSSTKLIKNAHRNLTTNILLYFHILWQLLSVNKSLSEFLYKRRNPFKHFPLIAIIASSILLHGTRLFKVYFQHVNDFLYICYSLTKQNNTWVLTKMSHTFFPLVSHQVSNFKDATLVCRKRSSAITEMRPKLCRAEI